MSTNGTTWPLLTSGISAEVLQSSSWVMGLKTLRTKQFLFHSNTELFYYLKLDIATKK